MKTNIGFHINNSTVYGEISNKAQPLIKPMTEDALQN
jgi:hypothetical protein